MDKQSQNDEQGKPGPGKDKGAVKPGGAKADAPETKPVSPIDPNGDRRCEDRRRRR